MSEHKSPLVDGEAPSGNGEIGRRRAIKVAAAAGVGVATWAQPTIRGLATTPAYAAAGSSGTETTFTIPAPVPFLGFLTAGGWGPVPPGLDSSGVFTDMGNSVQLEFIDNAGTVQLRAVATDCTCTVSASGGIPLLSCNPDPGVSIVGVPNALTGTIDFAGCSLANMVSFSMPTGALTVVCTAN